MTRIGVVTFPGSLDDIDAQRAVRAVGAEPVTLWHASDYLDEVDAVILPGGFSYGDYLRPGAIARFAPIMEQVIMAADQNLPILGICNGFQVLCEAHLLPGCLVRNQSRTFTCLEQRLRVESTDTVWTCNYQTGDEIVIPLKNSEGSYQADLETVRQLEANDQIVFRYLDNPNGSINDIAGITNQRGNIVGLMPHPEHAIGSLTGAGLDGLPLFQSVKTFLTSIVI